MDLSGVLKFFIKNLGIFLIGAVFGLITSVVLYVAYIWVPTSGPGVGLGIIALIVPMFILMGIIGIVLGGIAGLTIFYLIKYLKKKK